MQEVLNQAHCAICDGVIQRVQRIIRAQDQTFIRRIFSLHRRELNNGIDDILENARVCAECNRRAEILSQAGVENLQYACPVVHRSRHLCVICRNRRNGARFATLDISAVARVFMDTGKLILDRTFMCQAHVDENGFLLRGLYPKLRATSSQIPTMNPQQLSSWNKALRAHYVQR